MAILCLHDTRIHFHTELKNILRAVVGVNCCRYDLLQYDSLWWHHVNKINTEPQEGLGMNSYQYKSHPGIMYTPLFKSGSVCTPLLSLKLNQHKTVDPICNRHKFRILYAGWLLRFVFHKRIFEEFYWCL